MCILFVACSVGRYRLIIYSQRDEFLDRQTEPADWHQGILGAVDLQDTANGSWFAVDAKGRVGVLLSITQPNKTKMEKAPSRGGIVHKYLLSEAKLSVFTSELKEAAGVYNGFQFVGLEPGPSGDYKVQSLANLFVDEIKVEDWKPGVMVFGNSPTGKPLQKILRAEKLFANTVKQVEEYSDPTEIVEALLKMTEDDYRCLPDPQLYEQTLVPEEHYAPLSAIRVRYPPNFRYGTRCHSILLIDHNGEAFFYERRLAGERPDPYNPQWETKTHKFTVEPL